MVTIQYYKLMERNIDYFNLRKYILSSLQGRGWGWVLFSLFIVLTACHRNNDDHTAVRKAAEQYYGYLAKGDVDRYMRGLADYDSLPESYRRELRDMFLQYLDRNSVEIASGYVEPALAAAAPEDRFQFERTGYFVADEKDFRPEAPVFNRTVTLKDSYKPVQ